MEPTIQTVPHWADKPEWAMTYNDRLQMAADLWWVYAIALVVFGIAWVAFRRRQNDILKGWDSPRKTRGRF